MYTIIIFVLVLSLLVFVHELGHFYTARRLGVRADEFGFGFPPRAIGYYKNKFGKWKKVVGKASFAKLEESEDESKIPAPGSTIYSINWIPLGGFVKIKGENGGDGKDEDSFAAKSVGRRALILSAGVIMNVILAWFLFSIGYMIGLPQATSDLAPGARVSEARVAVVEVVKDSPADLAGILEGDFIVRVNGQEVALESDVQRLVKSEGGKEIEMLLSSNGEDKTLTVTPQDNEAGDGIIGVALMAAGTVRYPIFTSIVEGAKLTGWMLKEIFSAFGSLIGGLFTGAKMEAEFAGPIGIANITGQAARLGFAYLLQFTALLSLNLAVINILPFPALDGGRILFLFIEKLKGKPVSPEVEAVFHNIGFMLLMALVIWITYKDILKLF